MRVTMGKGNGVCGFCRPTLPYLTLVLCRPGARSDSHVITQMNMDPTHIVQLMSS